MKNCKWLIAVFFAGLLGGVPHAAIASDECESLIDGNGTHDADCDQIPDAQDNCVHVANKNQQDSDKDGIGDLCDNCPYMPNALQIDTDGDGLGEQCEVADIL